MTEEDEQENDELENLLGISMTSRSSAPWWPTSAFKTKTVMSTKKSNLGKTIKPFNKVDETTLETETCPEDDAIPLNIELVHDPSEEV